MGDQPSFASPIGKRMLLFASIAPIKVNQSSEGARRRLSNILSSHRDIFGAASLENPAAEQSIPPSFHCPRETML
jgi:hypothetical protein